MLQVINFKKQRGGERGEKEDKRGCATIRTQPVASCKAAIRLCRTLISMYKYIQFTFAFGLVTALLSRAGYQMSRSFSTSTKLLISVTKVTVCLVAQSFPLCPRCKMGAEQSWCCGSILLIQVLKYQIIVTSCHRGFRKAARDSPAHCSK